MSIGLDIGVRRMRSLRYAENRLVGRSCRPLYSTLLDTRLHRGLLHQAQISFGQCEKHLVVLGDAAAELFESLQVPCRPLMSHGNVPQSDTLAHQVLASLFDGLLPEPRQHGEICCMRLPGSRDRHRRTAQGMEFLTHLARLRGYRPILLNSGMAVVLAELEKESFTGIGMTLEAATTDVSLVYHSVEIASCSIPCGKHEVDDQLAHEKNEREMRASDLYGERVALALNEAVRELAKTPAVSNVPQPMTLVAAGELSGLPGFQELLRHTVRRTEFPVKIQDVRAVAESDYTVARGCLIHAELETQTRRRKSTAA